MLGTDLEARGRVPSGTPGSGPLAGLEGLARDLEADQPVGAVPDDLEAERRRLDSVSASSWGTTAPSAS